MYNRINTVHDRSTSRDHSHRAHETPEVRHREEIRKRFDYIHSNLRRNTASVTRDTRARLRVIWETHSSIIKVILPYIIFLIYTSLGSATFLLVEQYANRTYDSRATDSDKCLSSHGYWSSLFFVFSLCSTIGFGVVYTCSLPTRIISVFYVMFGLPLMLLVLSDIGYIISSPLLTSLVLGKRICRVMAYVLMTVRLLWKHSRVRRFLKRRRKSTKVHSGEDRSERSARADRSESSIHFIDDTAQDRSFTAVFRDMEQPRNGKKLQRKNTLLEAGVDDLEMDDDISDLDETKTEVEDLSDVPITLGVSLVLMCMCLTAFFYWYIERYGPWESLYFSFLTFLSGDLQLQNFDYTAPVCLCVLLGFSMLSTTISIIQHNIANLSKRVQREVAREIEEQRIRREQRAALGLPPLPEDLRSADDILNEVMGKQGNVMLNNVIPERNMEEMHEKVEKTVNTANEMTQTDPLPPPPRPPSPPRKPEMYDIFTQRAPSFQDASISQQVTLCDRCLHEIDTQTSPARKSILSMTPTEFLIDLYTPTPGLNECETQTEKVNFLHAEDEQPLLHRTGSARHKLIHSKMDAITQTSAKSLRDCYAQTGCETEDDGAILLRSYTDGKRKFRDVEVQARAKQRTVGMQYPRKDEWQGKF